MTLYDKRIQVFYTILDTFFSFIRLLHGSSFRRTVPYEKKRNQLLILGNGPSLIPTLERNEDKLRDYDILAVNFMGLSPLYVKYKPDLYVLADSAFWSDAVTEETKQKVKELYDTIAADTTWDLTVYMPHQAEKSDSICKLTVNQHVHVEYFNKTKFEGFKSLCFRIYKKQLGMPRAQNVLGAAIMLGIYFKYPKIVLAGADNDWIRNTWVNEENQVCFNDSHFYENGEKNGQVKKSVLSMADSMLSCYFTFAGYADMAEFSTYMGCKVINLNPLSFIDSFVKTTEL